MRIGHVDVVRFLLEYSASVDDVDKVSSWQSNKKNLNDHLQNNIPYLHASQAGKTASDLASERGHLRVVQLIDEWQKPDPDPNQDTTRWLDHAVIMLS